MKEFVEKLISRLEEHCATKNEVCDCNGVCSECDFKASIEIVNQLAEEYSVTGGWIPVSERLPEKQSDYLICDNNRNVYSSTYKNNRWLVNLATDEVIAWMPLPDPYMPKKDEKK